MRRREFLLGVTKRREFTSLLGAVLTNGRSQRTRSRANGCAVSACLCCRMKMTQHKTSPSRIR